MTRSVTIVGLGWLGFSLGQHLKFLGWQIKGSRRTHEGAESTRLKGLDAYALELTPQIHADPNDINILLNTDALVINIPPSVYFFDLQQYVISIKNLVNEAILYNITHIIFVSSTSVFANCDGYFDEESLAKPDAEASKALCTIEDWLLTLHDVNCDILRLAGLVGKNRHPVNHLAGRHDLLGGNQPVNLVHIDDCIRAIQLLLESPAPQRLYHLVAPMHPTKHDYYTTMAKKLTLPAPHFICNEKDPKRIVLADKICQQLGFTYHYPDPYQMPIECMD